MARRGSCLPKIWLSLRSGIRARIDVGLSGCRRICPAEVDGMGEQRQLWNTVCPRGSTCGCAYLGFGIGGCSRCEVVSYCWEFGLTEPTGHKVQVSEPKKWLLLANVPMYLWMMLPSVQSVADHRKHQGGF
jgi:hypothetical protein